MEKIRVAYIVWNENIFKSNIFNNQVLDQLYKIKATCPSADISLIINVPLGPTAFRNPSQMSEKRSFLASLRKDLAGKSIELHTFNSYLSFNFNTKFPLLPFQYIESWRRAYRAVQSNKIEILHCRSYHSAMIGISLKLFNKKLKVIFDTRGRFPEEGIFRRSYGKKSLSYNIWKHLERKLIKNSDVIINVADTFTNYIEKSYPTESKGKNLTVYTSTNVELINTPPTREYPEISSKTAVGFIGELSTAGGYSIKNILEAYRVYRKNVPNPLLVLVTTSSEETIEEAVGSFEYPEEIKIYSTYTFQDTYNILSQCKFGIAALNHENAPLMEYLAPTIIAAKTGDYLCAGLPLIYDEKIGGVAPLIDRHQLGLTFGLPINEEKLANDIQNAIAQYQTISQNCKNFAAEKFSSTRNARIYVDLYKRLTSGKI